MEGRWLAATVTVSSVTPPAEALLGWAAGFAEEVAEEDWDENEEAG